ncbi:MAG: acetyl-CoA C-acetyltransferase [Psychrilyobacter sp.]|uniref:acetyl-CoA C-acetyltransferase n=1 Tax=Psychrilyobacter sp. TaxID=2586924 RepID=UPI003C75D413
MSKVYIVSAKRTAVGSFMGSLSRVKSAKLGGAVIRNVIEETKIDPKNIDEVILGNVLSAGQGQGVGRQAAIDGGVPMEVPAYTVNIICGSGMKSVMLAYNAIKSGEANLIMAGGVESMSTAPYLIPESTRSGHKMGNFKTVDHMVFDALTDAFNGYHMGVTAENIAEKYDLSKESQDTFALESQRKAIAAIDNGRFKDEIVPIEIKSRRETIIFDTDEHPNRKTSLEKLGKLKTIFKKDGTVTAGNASGINDGASVMLVASEKAVTEYNLTPLVEIVATGQGGVDPSIMGMGPVPAIKNVLKKAGMTLKEIELLELNEAFAAQSLGVMTELTNQYDVTMDWFLDKTNVNGGAIALGHPVGASGNRIATTLIHEMKKREVNFGLASLCIGGGMGTALILKNVMSK